MRILEISSSTTDGTSVVSVSFTNSGEVVDLSIMDYCCYISLRFSSLIIQAAFSLMLVVVLLIKGMLSEITSKGLFCRKSLSMRKVCIVLFPLCIPLDVCVTHFTP